MKNKLIIKPKVSIVLPVFNAGKYLKDCLESLLNQTYKNYELIIVDDHSTDNSYEILKEYKGKNKKIRIFRNNKNKGVSETAKKAISLAKGDYIARMDADDIAILNRLEKQIRYLENHPETVALGGQCITIDSKNNVIGEKVFPTTFNEIYKYIFRFIPVQQPTLMIAKNRLPKNFVYYTDGMNTAEEVELLFKLFKHGRVENLDETLLLYRIHDANTSFLNIKETFLLTLFARIKAIFVHNYKPDMVGIIYTFLQAAIVLMLPKRTALFIYKIIRNASILSITSYFRHHGFTKLSFFSIQK